MGLPTSGRLGGWTLGAWSCSAHQAVASLSAVLQLPRDWGPSQGDAGWGSQRQGWCRGLVSVPETLRGLAPLGPRVIVWTSPQVGDFAILLRAGFDRWSAAKLQLSTALGGLLGACFAICTQSPKGVGTGVAGGGGRWRSAEGPSTRGHSRPALVSRLGSALSTLWEGVQFTWLPWAPSQSDLLPPPQRRPWPGSCPSPLVAFSTSPW